MRNTGIHRLAAAALAVCLMTAPTAEALTVEQAGSLLQTYYVDEVPQSVLEQPTIEAMLEALGDPYTQYFTRTEYSAFSASMSDSSVVGIGVSSVQVENGIQIVTVLANSPAQAAGLQVGDTIIKVDGQDLAGFSLDDAIDLVKGEEGTKVKITYLRDGGRYTVTLTRATVVVPATTSELIDGYIGYISCTTFGEETYQHFQEAFQNYDKDADIWIVDLRDNSGGVTQAAVDAAGCFTGPAPMTYLRDNQGQYFSYTYEDEASTANPVIVLMNEYSASASELFASAIQGHRAGIVVGTRSYGKGVAQSVLDQSNMPEYFPDGDAFKITSDRFYSCAGNTTDQLGVLPALLVDPEMVGRVASLLAGPLPTSDTSGLLRISFHWEWFVDLDAAREDPEALQALLNAIPSGIELNLGTGQADGWQPITPAEVAALCQVEYAVPTFPDIEDSSYPEILGDLKTYDLIHGKSDGLFHPQDTLTRAELCQMLSSALNCFVPSMESPYSDVEEDAWYAPAVLAMTRLGLVNGVGKDLFAPETPVNHQQLITIASRMVCWLNFYMYEDAKRMPQTALAMPELSGYADWAKSSAWLLSYSQENASGTPICLLWEPAEDIDPSAPATRDEAAFLLFHLLSYTDALLI